MENDKYFITVATGLLTAKHREKMQVNKKTTALWMYMWFLDKITKIDSEMLGWVLGGKPIKLEDIPIHDDIKCKRKVFSCLEKEGYILTNRTPYGRQVWVTKAKKIFGWKVPKRDIPYNGSSGTLSGRSDVQKAVGLGSLSGRSNKTIQLDNTNKHSVSANASTVKLMKEHNENEFQDDGLEDINSETNEVLKKDPRVKKTKTSEKFWELIHWAENRRGGKFPSWKVQIKSIAQLKEADIGPEDIKQRWVELEGDKFYKDKLDFHTIQRSFDQKS